MISEFDIDSATLGDLSDFIHGRKVLPGSAKFEPVNLKMFNKFMDKLAQYDIERGIFEMSEYYKDFFDVCVDFKQWFPKQQKDLFYAAKCGGVLEGTPPMMTYLVKLALKNYNFPNMVAYQLNKSTLKACFKKGYFANGVTLFDVICNMYGKSYKTLNDYNLINECDDFDEVYIKNEDMVAVVPKGLLSGKDINFISNIHMSDYGLVSGDEHIMQLKDHMGVCDSYYDLRNLI